MAARLPIPAFQPVDANGKPLAGAKLYSYAAGTATPLATYADEALAVPNTNPLVADAAGRFGDCWLSDVDYKLVLKTKDGVILWSRDPVRGDFSLAKALADTAKGDKLIGVKRTATGAVATTLHDWLERQVFDAREFGAVGGDGVDDGPSIQAAINAASAAGGGTAYIPPGAYLVGAPLTVPSSVTLLGAGRGATKLTMSTNIDHIVFVTSAVNVRISGVAFYGTWGTAPTSDNYGGVLVSTACQRVLIEDCEFRDFRGNGIDLNVGNSFVTVRRNYFENNRVGVSVFKGNSDCRVVDNDMKQVREIGINVDDATSSDTEATASPNNRITVSRNHLYEVGTVAGSTGIAVQGSAYVSVEGNQIHRSGRAGPVSANAIVVNGGQSEWNASLYVSVIGNGISEGTAAGIVVKAARSVALVGNHLNDNWQWSSTLTGPLPEISIEPGASAVTGGVLIDNNAISDNGTPAGQSNYAVYSSSSDNVDLHVGANLIRGFANDYHYGGFNLKMLFRGLESLSGLPSVAYRGRQIYNQADDKLYIGTASGWAVVGSQS